MGIEINIINPTNKFLSQNTLKNKSYFFPSNTMLARHYYRKIPRSNKTNEQNKKSYFLSFK